MNKNKRKLILSKNTVRQLSSVVLPNVKGGLDDASGGNGTCHCASQRAHSGCPCAAQ
jgi:hypothetical protein